MISDKAFEEENKWIKKLLKHLEGIDRHVFYCFDSMEFSSSNLGDLAGYPFTKLILVSNVEDGYFNIIIF